MAVLFVIAKKKKKNCNNPMSISSGTAESILYMNNTELGIDTKREGFPADASGKESSCSAGDIKDVGLIPGSGRSPGGGHGNSLQYSCLENPMDRGAWQATILWVAKSPTRLKRLSMYTHMQFT